MQREVWSKAYRYKVFSGVKIVVINLTNHIPSHIMITGHRRLVSCEGQPTTCYGCDETGHFNQVCPKRRRVWVETTKEPTASWADIAVNGNRDTYKRNLSLSQRNRYVQAYLLAKIRHKDQVFPAPTTCTRQLTTAIAWYTWKGATFRVPISTLQKPKRQEGWGLIDIGRTWVKNRKKSSASATWLREWNLDGPRANSLHVGWIPMTLKYLYRYALDMAYIAPPGNDETLRTFKLRVYNTLHTMAVTTRQSEK